MIWGTGIDVVDVEGFAAQLDQPGTRFAEVFTAVERRDAAESAHGPVPARLAARYAAKEAFVKAWSGGFWAEPPVLPDASLAEIEVVRDAFGRPRLRLHGDVAVAVRDSGVTRAHVSLSHDGPVAMATVVLEGSQRMA